MLRLPHVLALFILSHITTDYAGHLYLFQYNGSKTMEDVEFAAMLII